MFWEGYCEWRGKGIEKNEENGKRKMFLVLTSGDGYWTFVYSHILSYGVCGFPKDTEKSKQLKGIWESQPISTISYFDPFYENVWGWQIN
jgi:hypothetical protein